MLARHTAAVAAAARAVESLSCGFLCAPEFKVKPTVTFEHLATGLPQAGVLIGGERSSTTPAPRSRSSFPWRRSHL